MVALLDDLGTWQELGVIVPQLGQFTPFPLAASSGFNTFRVIWEGDVNNAQTFCYLRAFYIRGGSTVFESQWRRLYPKTGEEIITIPFAPEFQLQQLERFLEIEKWAKWYRFRNGITDPSYQVRLLEFIPYPEVIAAVAQQDLTAAAVDQISANVIEQIRINFNLPNNNQLPPP